MKAFHEVRNYGSDLPVWQSSYENISFLAHWHQELELIYIISGCANFGINDEEFTAHEGDLVFVDTGDFHYSDSHEYRNALNFIVFAPTVISSHYQHSHFAKQLVTAAQLEEYGMTALTRRLFGAVEEELRGRKVCYREIVSAMLQEYVFRLQRCHPQMRETPTARSRRTELLYDMQHLLTYIDEHYSEDITLSFAAERMNFSESHFSKVFKKLVGINFIAYLNAVRIEQAADMLRTTGSRITDIALACGFGNIRSFNRTFKEYTGYTPSQFLRLPNSLAQHFSYYRRKSEHTEYVQDDSLTVVPNTRV